ncbi:MAG: CRISPR-associated protein Csx19 [Caldilinea sp.]|nr:TIGR03984 family CRISPR-associated protein [Anaerolineales bacterium]
MNTHKNDSAFQTDGLKTPERIDLEWLGKQADERNLRWMLLHADDGVNWGERRATKWVISHDVAPEIAPAFVPEHLQQVRLFGEAGELLLWRAGERWRGRWLGKASDGEIKEELYLLWGTEAKQLPDNFLLLNEGAEGLRHVPPAVQEHFNPAKERMALRIHHYLGYDKDGQVFVQASRLVNLNVQTRKGG